MEINVVYSSRTGHSKKLAQAIANELSLTALDLKQGALPENSDLMFLVTGIYAAKSALEVLEFIETLTPQVVKRVCLVTSSMSRTSPTTIRVLLEKKGIFVLPEEYKCRGSFLFFGMGHPTAEELGDAAQFAKEITAKSF